MVAAADTGGKGEVPAIAKKEAKRVVSRARNEELGRAWQIITGGLPKESEKVLE